MSTDDPNRHSPCCHALVLLGATGVVVLGTALVDPSRLWLLVVPIAWVIVGTSAAFALGVKEDLGLLAAGGVALLSLSRGRRLAAHAEALGATR